MFETKKNVSGQFVGNNVENNTEKLGRGRSWLAVALLALLFQSPVWATEPIAVDPDPDFTSTTTIYVDASEKLDIASLAPGHYVIVVVAEDGSQQSFEIWVD